MRMWGCSWPGQGAWSSALDALLGLGIGLSTEDFSFSFSFLDPSHMYFIGLRENYYSRFKVPAMRRCAEKKKGKKNVCPRHRALNN